MQIKRILDDAKAEYITCAYADLNGELRGHFVGRDYFEENLKSGLALCAEVMVIGVNDQIHVPEQYLSFDLPFSDQMALLAGSAARRLPNYPEGKDLFFFLDFPEGGTGNLWAPRQIYGRAEDRINALGYSPVVGSEYEFRVYAETEQTARAKGYKNLEMAMVRSGYMNIARQSQGVEFLSGLLDMCKTLSIDVASLHWEHGAGMLEIALAHKKGMHAPDNSVLFKTFAKAYADQHDHLASFMAKPRLEEDGSSCHVHLSLLTPSGRNVFYDAKAAEGMSKIQRHFIGGVQKLLPELMLMVAPNPNSWRRFVANAFAPLAATWGIENRTTSVRMIPGGRRSQRLEFRPAGADTNAYLVQACLLGMGAWGIEHQLEPTKPVERSAYMRQSRLPKSIKFPGGFGQAIAAFQRSKAARELFGDDFVEIYAGTRQAQLDELADKRGRTSHAAELKTFLAGA
ncbi:MAG: glutamine synthetase family protein [Pseudomonadales bacterium]